ncbi:hypothetical protein [Moraxella lacunata]
MAGLTVSKNSPLLADTYFPPIYNDVCSTFGSDDNGITRLLYF